jgi:hypothetical protein
MTEVSTNFEPETVILTPLLPASALVGLNPVTVGTGFKTSTLKLAVPPPGGELEMEPPIVPAVRVFVALREKVAVFPETVPGMGPRTAPVV